MKGSIRTATAQDAAYLAPRLREQDVQELWRVGHRDFLDVLLTSIAASDEAYTILAELEPVGVFGVAPATEPGVGIPWMLASDGLLSVRKDFVRYGFQIVEDFNSRYPLLTNVVWRGNSVSRRWLAYVGFEEVEPFGAEFIRFERKEDSDV